MYPIVCLIDYPSRIYTYVGRYAADDAPPLLFKCTGCGKCCSVDGAVYVNSVEITALAKAKRMPLKDFAAAHVGLSEEGAADDLNPSGDRRTVILDRAADRGGGCSLLNEDGRTCSVYNARPIQCATYPFWSAPDNSVTHTLPSGNPLEVADGLLRPPPKT